MAKKNKLQILFLIAALLLTSTACLLEVAGGPKYPDGTVPVSEKSSQGIQEQVKSAVENNGSIMVTFTEEQLTSFLHYKLAEQTKLPLSDPQVRLNNGVMDIYGKFKQGFLIVNVKISVHVSVDENGEPKIEIVSMDFGPLPIPEGINDTISKTIAEAYTGAIGPAATGFRIEQIGIGDGFMVISGKVK